MEKDIKKRKNIKLDIQLIIKIVMLFIFFIAQLCFIGITLFAFLYPNSQYKKAINYMKLSLYDNGIEILDSLNDYKNADKVKDTIDIFRYCNEGNYLDAIKEINNISGSYSIIYNTNGGIIFNEKLSIAQCSKNGYSFEGYKIEDYNISYSCNEVFLEIILAAQYELISYNIQLELFDGILDEYPTTYTILDTIEISEPTKKGYIFKGWHNNLTNITSKEIKLENNYGHKSYTALWEPVQYKITYDLDDGENSINNPTFYTVEMNNVQIHNPNRKGYIFKGWTVDNTSQKYTNYYVDTNMMSDICLKANWELISYRVFYDFNYATIVNHYDDSFNIYDDKIILPILEKSGYIFLGWSLKGSNEIFNTNFKLLQYYDLYFVPKFEPIQYKISFDTSGGELEFTEMVIKYNSSYTLPIPTKTGYQFEGWYFDGKKINTNGIYCYYDNIKLVAIWVHVSYTITVHLDDIIRSHIIYYGNTFNLTFPQPSDKIFKGYYTGVNGTGEQITDQYGKSLSVYTYSHNIHLYPYYECEISFITNGGDEIDSMYLPYGTNINSNIPAYKINRIFDGWYSDLELTNKVYNINKSCTVYAKWSDESVPTNFDYSISDNNEITLKKYLGNESYLIIPTHIGGMPVSYFESNMFPEVIETNIICITKYTKVINDDVFLNLLSLTTVNFYGNIDDWLNIEFKNENSTPMIYAEEINFMNEYGIYEKIYNIEVNNKNIGNYQFYRFNDLTEFTINANTYTLGINTFKDCINLKDVKLSKGIKIIPNSAFYNCYNLQNINIPEGVTTIESSAFYNCNKLNKLILPSTLTTISSQSFSRAGSSLGIFIPSSVVSMGVFSFSNFDGSIYCEADSKPSTWNPFWSFLFNSNSIIYWGYSLDDFENI